MSFARYSENFIITEITVFFLDQVVHCSSEKKLMLVEYARSKLVCLLLYQNDHIIFKERCCKSQALISFTHSCNILNDVQRFHLPKERTFAPWCAMKLISCGIPELRQTEQQKIACFIMRYDLHKQGQKIRSYSCSFDLAFSASLFSMQQEYFFQKRQTVLKEGLHSHKSQVINLL